MTTEQNAPITLQEFIATRKVIENQTEIALFYEKLTMEYDTAQPVKSLYVYEGDYHLEEITEGCFHCHIETEEVDGNLDLCEAYLYAYAKDELTPPNQFFSIPQSLEDVKLLFRILVAKLGLGFNPDTPGADYVVIGTHVPSFSPEVAEAYDKAMEAAFTICWKYEVDIYEIAMEYIQPLIQEAEQKLTK